VKVVQVISVKCVRSIRAVGYVKKVQQGGQRSQTEWHFVGLEEFPSLW